MRSNSQSAHHAAASALFPAPRRYATTAGNLTEKFILTSQSFQRREAAAKSPQNAADRQADSACRKAWMQLGALKREGEAPAEPPQEIEPVLSINTKLTRLLEGKESLIVDAKRRLGGSLALPKRTSDPL